MEALKVALLQQITLRLVHLVQHTIVCLAPLGRVLPPTHSQFFQINQSAVLEALSVHHPQQLLDVSPAQMDVWGVFSRVVGVIIGRVSMAQKGLELSLEVSLVFILVDVDLEPLFPSFLWP